MKALVVVIMMAGVAAADPSGDVTKLVQRHVAAISNNARTEYLVTLTKDAIVLRPWGASASIATDACKQEMTCEPRLLLAQGESTRLALAVGKISVGVDGKTAWFAAPIAATITTSIKDSSSGPTRYATKEEMRVVGIAVDDGGWKIAAVTYGKTLPDANLHSTSSIAMPNGWKRPTPKLTGDAGIGKAVAGWFPKGLVATRGANAVLAGSAPGSLATGTATTKLAEKWEALDIGLVRADARKIGGVGWVTGELAYPLPAENGVSPAEARLIVTAIVVADAGTWKWVAVLASQFSH